MQPPLDLQRNTLRGGSGGKVRAGGVDAWQLPAGEPAGRLELGSCGCARAMVGWHTGKANMVDQWFTLV